MGKSWPRNIKLRQTFMQSLRPKVTSIIAGSRKLTYEKLAVKMNKQGITGRNGGKFYTKCEESSEETGS